MPRRYPLGAYLRSVAGVALSWMVSPSHLELVSVPGDQHQIAQIGVVVSFRDPTEPTSDRPRVEVLEPRRHLSLTHQYTFNDGTANDSVGNAHGTLFNGATIHSGRLVLQNAGVTSGNGSAVQYARLPNGILPASGAASIEAWYTTFSATPNWMRVFDFGDQNGTNGRTYLFYTPKSSAGTARASLRPASGADRLASATAAANEGFQRHVVVTLNPAGNAMSLYLDGTLAGSTTLDGVDISSANEVFAYLGRSQFANDAGLSGSIDELRIYNRALNASEVAASRAAGPVRLPATPTTRQVERLDRGVVAISRGNGQAFVSWRLLGTDSPNVAFNLYRQAEGQPPVKLNANPLSAVTNYSDSGLNMKLAYRYFVRPVLGGVEQAEDGGFTLGANASTEQYLSVPMQIPPGGLLRDGAAFRYDILDASPADLDGDGQYELLVRWFGVELAASEFSAPMMLDAYRMDGTRLWRIDLGRNIAGPIDAPMVYDFDGDGRAEMIMRTADGTRDAFGTVIGDPNADHVNNASQWPVGWTVRGPEFLSVFNGQTGALLTSIPMEPARGQLTEWGDNYGQRAKQMFLVPAYLDGQRPSLVVSRGIYFNQSGYASQTQQVAYDYRNGQLVKRWHFRAALNLNNNINSNFVGQGNHQISVADVDFDGRDEIINGSMVVDDNGLPLASTQLEHGDAMHVGDLDPSRPGLEVFGIHENEGTYNPARPFGAAMYDPLTGVTIWGAGRGIDVGRGNAADIDPTRPGYENWGGPPIDNSQGAGVLRDVNGNTILNAQGSPIAVPTSNNFLVWWDGDLTRELLDRNYINKWNPTTGASDRLLTASNVATSEGTKQFPALTADLIGDWREEVVWKAADASELRIYTTVVPTAHRMVTLMHDTQYRVQVAAQANGYNQPPLPSFHIGAESTSFPHANVYAPQYVSQAPTGTPGDLNIVVVSPTQVNVAWQPVVGATGYRVQRSTDAGGTFYTIAENVQSLGYLDQGVSGGASFVYRVMPLNGIDAGVGSAAIATTELPSPWIVRDIGTMTTDARSSFADGKFTIRASAATSGDGLRMLSQDANGDFDLVTRIDGKSNRIGAAGLQFRASTASNAAFAQVAAEPTDLDRIFFRWRSSTGGSSSWSVGYNALPVWLRLTRRGNDFAAFYGTDGATWTQIGTNRTISMPATIPAGLMVSGTTLSHTAGVFSNVSMTPVVNQSPRIVGSSIYRQTSPTRLAVTFSEDVSASLSAGDFVVTPLVGGASVPVSFSWEPIAHRAWIDLPADASGAMPDGRYRLSVTANAVSDASGLIMSAAHQFDFHVLRGDLNGDASVNFSDLLILSRNYGLDGRVLAQGNADRDAQRRVEFADLLTIARSYGQTLPILGVGVSSRFGGARSGSTSTAELPADERDAKHEILS